MSPIGNEETTTFQKCAGIQGFPLIRQFPGVEYTSSVGAKCSARSLAHLTPRLRVRSALEPCTFRFHARVNPKNKQHNVTKQSSRVCAHARGLIGRTVTPARRA